MMVQMRNPAEHLDGSTSGQPVTCEEFQSRMPELFTGDIHEHEHLKTCARCRALLEDLEQIAFAASELLPEYEPRDTVWSKISASLPKSTDEVIQANGHLAESPVKG